MIACEQGEGEIVRVLISKGASVALKNKNGLTAVHIACRMGRKDILCELFQKAKEQKHFNFRRNFQSDYELAISTKTREGWTPLLYAVREGHLDILEDCFAEEQCHDKTRKNHTALHIAARYQRLDCLKQLLSRSSMSMELKLAMDKNGWNILHHASARGGKEMLQWLVENVPEVRSEDLLNKPNNAGYTPLLIACEYQQADAVRYLLELTGVDVSACAADTCESEEVKGKSALHIAAIHDNAEIAEMLIRKGCPLLVQDLEGNTALHVAYRRSSNEVVDLLHNSPDGQTLEETLNFEPEPKLPRTMRREDVIPFEISKKGNVAVGIYIKALRKGKQKIPRCNLLILGDKRTGKTSVYKLLVGKKFDPHQLCTRGIDNNVVETVDKRHITSDTWEEKASDDQKQQSKKLFALGVAKEVRKELPVNKLKSITDSSYSKTKLIDELQSIKKALLYAEHESRSTHVHQQQSRIQYEVRPLIVPKSHKRSDKQHHVPPASSSYKPTISTNLREPQPERPSRIHTTERSEQKAMITYTTTTIVPKKTSETPKPKKEKVTQKSKAAIQLSRGHSKAISELIKSGDDGDRELPLTYNVFDFAGQNEYRPMHHCFITRRAIYLVVFNLQKMIQYIVKGKQEDTDNPLEEIRYWLHSIHAHVFPPKEGDHMRRVCLVGTHRAPQECEELSVEQLKLIDNELKSLEHDKRCVSHVHYTTDPERMFVAVENSIEDPELSGVLQLRGELKGISDNLPFLKEDYPIIWLNFEAHLVETCDARKRRGKSVVVPVQEVLDIACQLGLEEDEDQRLALQFFHDTGKIVCLDRLPTLFLPDQEDQLQLKTLVILDPMWLVSVMRVVMELNCKSPGDRNLIFKLTKTGIASDSLLREKWAAFFSASESTLSFKMLCLMLQAYCLIFPLKEHTSGDPVTSFLIPSMLPEVLPDEEVDCGVPWVRFYFDFEKFLPEEIYHRLICIMLANIGDPSSDDVMPKFSKLWSCFYDIDDSHWRFDLQRGDHRLKVSILTEHKAKRSEHFLKIHDYLQRICTESYLQGLKYFGGPEVKCKCLGFDRKPLVRVLKFAEYIGETQTCKTRREVKCRKCFQVFKLDEVINKQIPKPESHTINGDEAHTPLQCKLAVSTTTGVSNVDPQTVKTESKEVDAMEIKAESTSAQPAKHVAVEPKLQDLLKELYSTASKWEDIGILLGIDSKVLDNIKATENSKSPSCLREMLKVWIKRVNPPCSWSAIAEAVEFLGDEHLADQLRTKYHVLSP